MGDDLKPLEALNLQPDAEWLVFLKNGYKQSGASAEQVRAAEDRVIQSFPHSDEAWRIVRERWEKAHQEPEYGTNAAAWAKYHRDYRAALQSWIAQFTDSRELQHEELYYAAWYDPDMPEEAGRRAVDDYLAYIAEYQQPSIDDYLSAAWVLQDHNWEPKRVFDLLRASDKLIERGQERLLGDNLSAEAQHVFTFDESIKRQAAGREIVVCRKACRGAGESRAAQTVYRTRTSDKEPT